MAVDQIDRELTGIIGPETQIDNLITGLERLLGRRNKALKELLSKERRFVFANTREDGQARLFFPFRMESNRSQVEGEANQAGMVNTVLLEKVLSKINGGIGVRAEGGNIRWDGDLSEFFTRGRMAFPPEREIIVKGIVKKMCEINPERQERVPIGYELGYEGDRRVGSWYIKEFAQGK